ncbi:MAG: hypothetical protein DCF22_13845 [Leptolyngbya sp.]|nr:MAG: hypothetical protein DCF22_13845 [Leptolyngbya sp.]
MAGLLNTSSTMMCPHGGTVSAISSNTKTKAGGSYVLRSSDTFTIAGCPFALGSTPHPCVQVRWVQTSLKSKVVNNFVLTADSVGLCIAADRAAQGTVLIQMTQSQVSGL